MSNNPFKKKPKYHFFFGNESVGGFNVDFYMTEKKPKKCYMRISGKSDRGVTFEVKLNGYSYGFLMESARQCQEDNIHGFCAMLFILASEIYQDQGLRNDIVKAITKYQNRQMKRAESEAAKIDEATEQADQAFMEDIASEQGLSKKELKAKREADKEAMREVLNEVKEDKVKENS